MADDVLRGSRPEREAIERNPKERARREAANGLRQTDGMLAEIAAAIASDTPFRLRPSLINRMNRLAVEGLTEFAGVPRPHGMTIYGSKHQPPPASKVQELVEGLCDYVNEQWARSPIHLAAYVMWRLNWIHPFDDGNGRTSRAVAYIVLSVRLKTFLPGRNTIVEQISRSKGAYYRALEAADVAWAEGRLDVSQMEELLAGLLAAQFAAIHSEAKGET